jgi:hypothetical protein
MNSILSAFHATLLILGPKVKEAWPHLLALGQEFDHLLTIMNGGHPVVHSAGPLSGQAQEVYDRLVLAGIPSEEATQFAGTLSMASDRFSS